MLNGKSIAVVIPAYNEALLIHKTIQSIPAFVDIICVVDDASTDGTASSVAQLHDPRMHLVTHVENQGVGAAIITGYRTCDQLGADVIAVMAGDAQMDPDDLVNVVSPVVHDTADYCKGDRLSWKGVHRVMPSLRFFGNHILSILTRLTSGYPHIRDSQCGYTAISRQVLSRMNLTRIYTRYGFPNDILAHLYTVQGRVAQVTVRPIYAAEVSGISLYTAFVKVPLVLLRSLHYRLRNRPSRQDVTTSASAEQA
ncbi:MAG: glycosyltransferase family 2 protein [Deltaproteobacteria bacterium]|nr:glycosyltransferase family 2 protein [Deltaproteobacteria bacterium]